MIESMLYILKVVGSMERIDNDGVSFGRFYGKKENKVGALPGAVYRYINRRGRLRVRKTSVRRPRRRTRTRTRSKVRSKSKMRSRGRKSMTKSGTSRGTRTMKRSGTSHGRKTL